MKSNGGINHMDFRVDRMNTLIVNTFFDCLEAEDFSNLTVGKLSKAAQINRSTFYRHFEDKYHLRDYVVDNILAYFTTNLEVNFLDLDIHQDSKYTNILKNSLKKFYTKKRELEILWNHPSLGRNVFEEMVNAGAEKLEHEILTHKNISLEKKKLADWYAKLLINNMLVTIRWWFSHGDLVTVDEVTDMMREHMIAGTIPTLKS